MAEHRNANQSPLAPEAPPALTQGEIDQRVFDLYDEYCHGRIDRREFLQQAAAVTVGGLAMAVGLLLPSGAGGGAGVWPGGRLWP